MTGRTGASASSSRAWAPTARWACGPSRRKPGWSSCRTPASAKFDGMPRSAIDAGLADVVAPAEELPGRIIAYLQHAPLIATPDPSRESKAQSALEKVVILLRTQTGHDFSLYKKSTIYRRIERRMGLHQIDKIADLCPVSAGEPPGAGPALQGAADRRDQLLPRPGGLGAVERRGHPGAAGGPARQAGCCGPGRPAAPPGRKPIPWPSSSRRRWSRSSRPETFRCRSSPPTWTGTPSTRPAQGVYPANIAADVSPERLRRFFVQDEHGYRVGKEIREMVIFAPQNVIMDPPFTKLDLLICRNLLIYLDAGAAEETPAALSLQPESRRHPVSGQRRDHRRLHRSLRPAGRQDAALPAARLRPAGRAGRIPLLVLPRSAACRNRAAPGADARPPTSSRWRINCSCSASPRPPC